MLDGRIEPPSLLPTTPFQDSRESKDDSRFVKATIASELCEGGEMKMYLVDREGVALALAGVRKNGKCDVDDFIAFRISVQVHTVLPVSSRFRAILLLLAPIAQSCHSCWSCRNGPDLGIRERASERKKRGREEQGTL